MLCQCIPCRASANLSRFPGAEFDCVDRSGESLHKEPSLEPAPHPSQPPLLPPLNISVTSSFPTAPPRVCLQRAAPSWGLHGRSGMVATACGGGVSGGTSTLQRQDSKGGAAFTRSHKHETPRQGIEATWVTRSGAKDTRSGARGTITIKNQHRLMGGKDSQYSHPSRLQSSQCKDPSDPKAFLGQPSSVALLKY